MEKDWVVLKIDEHRMWVSLMIKEPEGEEHPYFSPEFIEGYLRENGITAGIIKEAVQALSASAAYGQEIVVARGKEPVKGRNGCYNYTVRLEDAKAKPVVNADGSVDYYNSLKLAMVNKDDIFAVYVPATQGEYGYTVFSEILPPVKGREQKPLRGKGFTVSEDGREYKALYDGRIFRENERIIIENIYIVKGDLDIERGNIKFNGDVEIKGDVRTGLGIETDGSIFIHGHVGGCRLSAGGNITVRKGIQGRNRCYITAGGDVACSFIERCSISAGGNVYADSVLDSDIIARNQVIVSSKKGLAVGGTITGMQGIMVKEAGNAAGLLTVLYAGITSDYLKNMSDMKEQSNKVNAEIEFLDKNLRIYESFDGNRRTKETEAVRMKILRAKVIKAAELKRLNEDLDIMGAEIEKAKRDAVVRIKGIAYAGIKICMGRDSYVAIDTCRDVVYKLINGGIVVAPGED